MRRDRGVTGAEGGLTGWEQIRIALRTIVDKGGVATIEDIYNAVEIELGQRLSFQGRSSLRHFVNKTAVDAGYIEPHSPTRPGWRPTLSGRHYAGR